MDKYRRKLDGTYRNRLLGLVAAEFLEPAIFFQHYQILRNIALLSRGPGDRLVFLLPRENDRVRRKLMRVIEGLPPETRLRVQIVFMEPLLESLLTDKSLPRSLREHAVAIKAKYIPLATHAPHDDVRS